MLVRGTSRVMGKKEILKFISNFKDMQDHYLYGKCYWFAIILQTRFGGVLYYNQVENHWVTKIGETLYDVQGVVNSTDYEEWPGEIIEDTLYYNRLVRDCINFDE